MEGTSSARVEAADWSRLLHIGAHEGAVESRTRLDELGLGDVHRICIALGFIAAPTSSPASQSSSRRVSGAKRAHSLGQWGSSDLMGVWCDRFGSCR